MKDKCTPLIIIFCIVLSGISASSPLAAEKADRISARIGFGIQSKSPRSQDGSVMRPAKAKNIIRSGELLRLYVCSDQAAFVYVIHTDQKRVTLLNQAVQHLEAKSFCLPSSKAFYQVDGTSPLEKFTIILSPKKLPMFEQMAENNTSGAALPPEQWAETEAELIRNSQIELIRQPRQSQKAIEIAGNVRGPGGKAEADPFFKTLPVSSGKGLLIRTYEFKIQK